MAKTPHIFNFSENAYARILVGAYRPDKEQRDWIIKHEYYNIRAEGDLFTQRDGQVDHVYHPDYILIYNCECEKEYYLYSVKEPGKQVSEQDMINLEYPNPQGSYILYSLGNTIQIPKLNLSILKKKIQSISSCCVEHSPSILLGSEIMNAIEQKNRNSPELKFIDLFAGIGGIRLPFDELGYNCVFSSEWDKAAATTYEANFGEKPYGDITKIAAEDIPHHNLLLAGFPCQAFSICGKMQGFADTRGTMFFEVARILDYHRPEVILLENVKQLVSHDNGNTFKVILATLNELGYYVKWRVLNALDFGVPQKRERVIIVGFRDPAKCEKFSFDFSPVPYDLATILENDDEVDHSLVASDAILAKRQERVQNKELFYPSIWHENKAGNISVLPYACALRTGASYNYLLVNGYRRPSSRELLRLQGFPDSYKIAVSHSEIRRQTGNSVAVPMIRAVAQRINELIRE